MSVDRRRVREESLLQIIMKDTYATSLVHVACADQLFKENGAFVNTKTQDEYVVQHSHDVLKGVRYHSESENNSDMYADLSSDNNTSMIAPGDSQSRSHMRMYSRYFSDRTRG